MNQNRYQNLFIVLLLIVASSLSGCQKKRISYVDMIKRETKEIDAFIAKENIKVTEQIPEGKMADGVYAKLEDGLYLHIIDPGNGNKLENGKTVVSARFSVKSISDPTRGDYTFSNYGAQSGGTHPLPFIYYADGKSLQIAPNATFGEQQNKAFLCIAMQKALQHVTENARVSIITSFRYGPGMATEQGVALYFDHIQFESRK